jgi:glycosyltransferase involved in cell wall biosynthesis
MTAVAPVTVIIPAFNAQRWVGQAIDSALDQTLPPAAVIVVDDGSTDGTALTIAGFGRRVRCIRQPNRGVAAARNAGLALADTPWIAFLDADDVWHRRKLELQMRVLADRPDIGLLGTGLFAWPSTAEPTFPTEPVPVATLIRRDRLAVRNALATSSVLLRRDVAERVGGFDTALSGPEDHDYWLRAADVAAVALIPLMLTGYRTVPQSLSKRAASMEAGMRQVLRKLDARDFWRGDRLLRRRAYGRADYSAAYLHGAAGQYGTAIGKLLTSIMWYPLPSRWTPEDVAFGRARRLAVLALRMLGIMRPDPQP